MGATKKTVVWFALVSLVLGSTVTVSAQNDGDGGDKRPLKSIATLRLSATAQEGKIYLRWNADPANDWRDGWQYWKVVRSVKNSSPAYPEDGYIKYESDRTGFSSYIDENPESSTAYYRVCAITDRARYCSNVVKVAGQQTKLVEEPQKYEEPTTTSEPIKPALAWGLKAKVDALAISLKKNLDAKFGDDHAKKAEWLDAKIAQVAVLKDKAPALVEYLLTRLEYLRDAYRNSALPSEIESLLKVE